MTRKFSQKDIDFMREACWCCDSSNCVYKTGCVAVKTIEDKNGTKLDEITLKAWNEIPNDLDKKNLDNKNPSYEKINERDYAIHSEVSLINQAKEKNINLNNATLYVTKFPCLDCAKLIFDAGIKKVFYMMDLFTTGNTAQSFFDKHKIETVQIKEQKVWENFSSSK